nr:PREDICTED: LOW QUALITY PROTEIN: cation transport regulator-like protein 1 [Struthio camelus australis]
MPMSLRKTEKGAKNLTAGQEPDQREIPLRSAQLLIVRMRNVSSKTCHALGWACTWGVAYEVCGEQIAASLQYLNMREAVLGGYDTKLVKFHPQDKDAGEPILALVYIATPQNPSYLGPASEEDIAAQIIVSSGCAGHNIEYLLRLADFMRYFCPQAEDEHLFSIEEALISILPCLYCTEESLEETADVPQKPRAEAENLQGTSKMEIREKNGTALIPTKYTGLGK